MSHKGMPPPPSKLASRGIQPRFGELAQSCRQLLMNRLAEHLDNVFAQVDDTLFECAEKAENNQVQTLFFDSMREVRKRRSQIERAYHRSLSRNLSESLDNPPETPGAADPLDAEQLTLVRTEDYEESLQIAHMVGHAKARCAQSLFGLGQRLQVLTGGRSLGEDENPFGPLMIAQAYRDAMAPCPFPLRVKSVLYTLFERHVMQGLDALYADLNTRLIEAGILPHLKYRARRSRSAARPSAPASPPDADSAATARQPGTPAEGAPATDADDLLNSLSGLLARYRRHEDAAPLPGGARRFASFAPRGASRTYDATQLLDALNRMQRQSASEFARHRQRPQEVESLKADLQRQLESHSRQPGQHRVSEQAGDVIDLVGMVFAFILDDENLPDSCKIALSHLHTPYLKIALLDKALFVERSHPARCLLDSMARAGVLYGGDDDEGGLLATMQRMVEQVIQRFDGDLQLFIDLQREFDNAVTALGQKVALRERREVEAAKGRDKLLEARQLAGTVIARSLGERDPPGPIRAFLELTWMDVLVFVRLRHGERSEQWQRAAEAAEHLAWGATPLGGASQERLRNLRGALLDDLGEGLRLLGCHHEDGIQRLLADLVACQDAVQAGQPESVGEPAATLPESRLDPRLKEYLALAMTAPEASSLSPRAQIIAKELGHLEPGTWFEFQQDGGSRRLKLSWFSPGTHNCMFVDHSGQQVMIKPLTLLATEMEHGLIRVSANAQGGSPLMDRALSAIHRVLQRFAGRHSGTR